MEPLELEPVNFHTPGKGLRGAYVVQYADGRNALIDVDGRDAKVFTDYRALPRTYRLLGNHSELGDVAIAARRARPRSAFRLPPGRVIRRHAPGHWAQMITTMAAGVAVTAWAGELPLLFGAFLATILVGLLLPQGAHRYAVDGVAHPLHALVDRDHDERAGVEVVDEVKAEYGALLTDVVYRIEHSALFDPAAPTTRTYTELMIRWDNDRDRLRSDERQELAADIRVAFDTARRHAEAVGLDHLPRTARAQASVAARALRLATDESTTEAERRAALAKANDILRSLMIYYLPEADDVAALVGGEPPRALPGRRAVSA